MNETDFGEFMEREGKCMNMGLTPQERDAIFFPNSGGQVIHAQNICRQCDIRSECLDNALEHDLDEGVYGAESARGRARIRRFRALGLPDHVPGAS